MLTKIQIKNYRAFKDFSLDFTDGLNVIVGDNDAGKSTLLEAVNLALTSRLRGRFLANELSPHLFNQDTVASYVVAVGEGANPAPPEILIDLYLEETDDTAFLKGRTTAASKTPQA